MCVCVCVCVCARARQVPFTMCTNTTYTHAVEDVVLGSLESARLGGSLSDGGMDFWWIDWQQGGNHGGCAGLKQNPTIWTNKVHPCCTRVFVRESVWPARVAAPMVWF